LLVTRHHHRHPKPSLLMLDEDQVAPRLAMDRSATDRASFVSYWAKQGSSETKIASGNSVLGKI